MRPNGCRAILGVYLGLILAVPARSQFIVPIPKTDTEVTVPKLEGLDRADAEDEIASAGLVLGKVTEKENQLPEGTIIKQQPASGTKAAKGAKVSLTVSKGPPSEPTAGHTTPSGKTKIPSLEGKTFSDAYQTLSDLGFTVIKPKRIEGAEPSETVVGVLIAGRPMNTAHSYSFGSEVTVLISTGSGGESGTPEQPGNLTITTAPLVMTGMRVGSLTINTQPLVMTGMRVQAITIATDTLKMTGIRIGSLTINTQPLVMTGIRPQSLTITTAPLVMTGMRVGSLTINTQPLVMSGMRHEEPNQPVEGKNTKIKKTGEKDLDKKLDLPLKKTQMIEKAKDPGQINGKTGVTKLPGETPDLEPVQQSLPIGTAEPLDKTVSTPLKQKLEGLQDVNVQKGIEPPAGTNTPVTSPAGTETTAPDQKHKDIQESLKGKTPTGEKPANVKTGTDAGQK